MVMIGRNISDILANRKSSSDFTKEAEEFEAKKRERAMAEQLGQLQIRKTEKDLTQFDPKEIESLAAKSIFESAQGLPVTAQGKAAIEAMAAIEGDKTQYKADEFGNLVPTMTPNPYKQYLGGLQSPQASIEQEPLPDFTGLDPVAANMAARAPQAQRVALENGIPVNPPMPGQLVPVGGLGEFPQIDERELMDMPAAQVAQMGRIPSPQELMANVPSGSPKTQQLAQEEAVKLAARTLDPEVAMKQREEAEKAQARQKTRSVSADIVTTEADAALSILENRGVFSAGTPAAIAQFFGETDAGKLAKSHLAAIKANAGFDKMMEMKQQSPTGTSGLGQLTQEERKTLEQTLGTLSVTQDPQILENNIRRIHNIYMDGVHGRPEEIRANAVSLGLTPQQVNELTFRYPVSRPQPSEKQKATGITFLGFE